MRRDRHVAEAVAGRGTTALVEAANETSSRADRVLRAVVVALMLSLGLLLMAWS